MKALFTIVATLWVLLALSCFLALFAFAAVAYSPSDPILHEPTGLLTLGVAAMICLSSTIAAFTNGILMFRKKSRRLSTMISAAMCLAFPFGTLLGICSLFVLSRPEVKEQYS